MCINGVYHDNKAVYFGDKGLHTVCCIMHRVYNMVLSVYIQYNIQAMKNHVKCLYITNYSV